MDIWSKIVEVNIGRIERGVRVLVGFGLLAIALFGPTSWGIVGVYPLLTGVFGTDPVYTLLGLNTTAKPEARKPPRPLPPVTDAP